MANDKKFKIKNGLDVGGVITDGASGTSTNWNTAYGWGDHSLQNYIIDAPAGGTSGFSYTDTLYNPNAYGTTAGDGFGASLALSANYIVAGAINEDPGGASSMGEVYIFNRATKALLYSLPNTDITSPYSWGTTIAANGDFVAIGHPLGGTSASGTVHVFEISTQTTYIIPGPNLYTTAPNDNFGYSVAMTADYLVVGSPGEYTGATGSGAVYVFNTATRNLLYAIPNPTAYGNGVNDYFGSVVAVHGNKIIVGVPFEDDAGGVDSGKAYIFDATNGTLLHTLDNPNAYGTSASDNFGSTVSICNNYSVVGALYEDSAAGLSSGRAYVFDNNTGLLVHSFGNPTGDVAGDTIGNLYKLGITDAHTFIGIGNQTVGGVSKAGQVFVMDNATGTLAYTIDNPNVYGTAVNDNFGTILAVDDNSLIVGVPSEDDAGGTQSGVVYIFDGNFNTLSDIWNLAYSWGDHSLVGYLTSYINTTYSQSAVTTAGGAFLRLSGSDTTTDDIKLASGTNVTVAYTDDNTITLSSIDTTYTAGTGLSLTGTTFNHSNSITAGAVSDGGSTRTLAFDGIFNVPSVTYDAQGHITATSSIALTMPANPNTDTLQAISNSTTNTNYYVSFVSDITGTAQVGYGNSNLTFNPSTGSLDVTGSITENGFNVLTQNNIGPGATQIPLNQDLGSLAYVSLATTSLGGTGLTAYAQGDILYASAVNTLSALVKGTDNQVLTLSSGLPSWVNAKQNISDDASTNTDRYITFVNNATGAQEGSTNANLLFNPSTKTIKSADTNSSNAPTINVQAGSATGNNYAGGLVSVRGGDGNGTGNGGGAWLVAGTAGLNSTLAGAQVSVVGGMVQTDAATGSPKGGKALIVGGDMQSSSIDGYGGDVYVQGGSSSGGLITSGNNNHGGNAYIRGGNASGANVSNTNGIVYIGDANTSAVNIGTSGITSTIGGDLVVNGSVNSDLILNGIVFANSQLEFAGGILTTNYDVDNGGLNGADPQAFKEYAEGQVNATYAETWFQGRSSAYPFGNEFNAGTSRFKLRVLEGNQADALNALYSNPIENFGDTVMFGNHNSANRFMSGLSINGDKVHIVSNGALSTTFNNGVIESYSIKMVGVGDSAKITFADNSVQVTASVDSSKAFGTKIYGNGTPLLLKQNGELQPVVNGPYYDNTIVIDSNIFQGYMRAAKIDSSRYLLTFKDDGTGELSVRVGTVTNDIITYGTAVAITTDTFSWLDIAMIDADRFIVVWDNSFTNGKCIIGSVTGNVITLGTEQIFVASQAAWPDVTGIDVDKVAISYQNPSYQPTVVICTVTGLTITPGTPVAQVGINATWSTIAKLSATSFVLAWDSNSTNLCQAVIGTVSGTTITFTGATYTLHTGAMSYPQIAALDSITFAATYFDNVTNNTLAKICSVSGTVITQGAETVIGSWIDSSPSIIETSVINSTSFVTCDSVGRTNLATVSGLTVTFSPPALQNYDMFSGQTIVALSPSVVILSNLVGDSIVGYPGYTNIRPLSQVVFTAWEDLTNNNFLGFFETLTGKVNLSGAINSWQSGLTPLATYYIQPDGTLSTTPGTPAIIAGKALSATEILVGADTTQTPLTQSLGSLAYVNSVDTITSTGIDLTVSTTNLATLSAVNPTLVLNDTRTTKEDWVAGDVIGNISFYTQDLTQGAHEQAFIKNVVQVGGTDAQTALAFGASFGTTSSTEVMRITSQGLSINSTAYNSDDLYVNGTSTFTSDVKLSGGTVNQVLYLDSTNNKITSSANFKYDGSTVAVGTAALSPSRGLTVSNTGLTGTSQYGTRIIGYGNAAATTKVVGLDVYVQTAASTFTQKTHGIIIGDVQKGAGTTVLENRALTIYDQSTLSSLDVAVDLQVITVPGYNKWNLYASGDAPNYMNGSLGIGNTSFSDKLHVEGTAKITGNLTVNDVVLSGNLRGPATFYIDPSPNDTAEPGGATTDTGTVVILGDLQVTGATTTINSTTVNVADLNVQLATGATNSAAANGAGITIDLGTDGTSSINWDSTNSEFDFSHNLNVPAVTLSGGTANGVPYLNGSKVLTSGSALTFDGTTFIAKQSSNPVIRLESSTPTSSTGMSWGSLEFYSNDTDSVGVKAKVSTLTENTVGATSLLFSTAGAFTDTLSEKYRITSDGTSYWTVSGSEQMRLTSTGLGIGTSSPANKLHVEASEANKAIAYFNNTDTANGNGLIVRGGGSNSGKYVALFQSAAGSELFRITNTGNVGIGTSSPAVKLDVSGNARITNSDPRFDWKNSSRTYYWQIVDADNRFRIVDETAGSERLAITSSGNLGLGVTPSAWQSTRRAFQFGSGGALHGFSGNEFVSLASNEYRDSAGAATYILTAAASKYEQYLGAHKWYTAPNSWNGIPGDPSQTINFTQAMTLDASGNWILGATSGSARATIAAASPIVASRGTLYLYSTDSTAANLGGQLSLGGSYTGTSETIFASVAGRKENGTGADISGYLQFSTTNAFLGNVERARIDSSGNFGLGVTPSAWGLAGSSALQIKNTGIMGYGNDLYIYANAYNSGAGTKYIASDFASVYYQDQGKHVWATAPSGTADTAISFTQAMTLDASGNLSIGTTSSVTGMLLGGDNKLFRISSSGTAGDLTLGQWDGTTNRIESVSRDLNIIQYGASNNITFSTNATERARIESAGSVLIGKTAKNIATVGHQFLSDTDGDYAAHTSSGTRALLLNRLVSNGDIAEFYKDGGKFASIGVASGIIPYFVAHAGDIGGLGISGSGTGSIYPCNTIGAGKDAALNLGGTTTRFKDLYLSGNAYVDSTVRVKSAFTLDANEGTSSTATSVFTLFAHASYGAAKIIVTAKDGVNRQISELLITHDGTTAVVTEYGLVYTSSVIASYSVAINGANVELSATSATTSGVVYNIVKTLID